MGAFQPRFESSSADRADRVTRVRYQELLFSASVLGAAIALHNCRHPGEYALRTVDFPVRNPATFELTALPAQSPPQPRVSWLRRVAYGQVDRGSGALRDVIVGW